jgi:hypothetical protein
MVERAGADLAGCGLDRLDRPDEPAGRTDAVAIASSRNATSRSAVRQIADSSGRERLAERFLDEDAPAERRDRLDRR